jgi:hypothetical protein
MKPKIERSHRTFRGSGTNDHALGTFGEVRTFPGLPLGTPERSISSPTSLADSSQGTFEPTMSCNPRRPSSSPEPSPRPTGHLRPESSGSQNVQTPKWLTTRENYRDDRAVMEATSSASLGATSGDSEPPSPRVQGGGGEGRNRLVGARRSQTKRCAPPPQGCGLEKDLSDFYGNRIQESTGHVVLLYRCKECTKKASRDTRLIRRGGGMFAWVGEERVLVVFPVEPMFVLAHEPEPEAMRFPLWGTTPLCYRGDHEWPVETVCRGYEALGCYGEGTHVHRRCVAHSCEEIEQAPAALRRRT